MSDDFITLRTAIASASTAATELAQRYVDGQDDELNWISAGLLAETLVRDAQPTDLDLLDVRTAIMLLTQPQFSAILQALAHGEAQQLVERIDHDGAFPATWG